MISLSRAAHGLRVPIPLRMPGSGNTSGAGTDFFSFCDGSHDVLKGRRRFPVAIAAVLLIGGILSACDDDEGMQWRVFSAPLIDAADETRRPLPAAPLPAEERGGHVAVEAIERGWMQTKDAARQAGEALARAAGEPDEVVVRIWEQTKERARRAGEVVEETAAAPDRVLGLAWQHAKDAAERVGEAWGRAVPADEDDEVHGEVRL